MELNEKEFKLFSNLIYEKSGIFLRDNKKPLVHSRLSKRMRKLNISSFEDYYHYVEKDKSNEEIIHLIDAISTNVTSFFRENNHFELLKTTVIPEIIQRQDEYINIWSAACSTGEEPYSIALTLQDALANYKNYNLKILATDISKTVLEKAESGIYPKNKIDKEINFINLQKYFDKVQGNKINAYRVKEKLKEMIRFRMFNLNSETWPFKKKFDFIFCRNVMIYFNKETQTKLISKFYDVLKPNGYLFVGHSESLTGIKYKFKYYQATVYKKQG
jgi:chemotaxis protein methyltransferase CheR